MPYSSTVDGLYANKSNWLSSVTLFPTAFNMRAFSSPIADPISIGVNDGIGIECRSLLLKLVDCSIFMHRACEK